MHEKQMDKKNISPIKALFRHYGST